MKETIQLLIFCHFSLEWILRKNWMLEVEREQEVIKTHDLKGVAWGIEGGSFCYTRFLFLYDKSFFVSIPSVFWHILQHSCYIYPFLIDTSIYFRLYQLILLSRASIEPNFHDLYLKFLDKVNSKALNKEIVQATYENCKVWALLLFPAWLKWRCVKILK